MEERRMTLVTHAAVQKTWRSFVCLKILYAQKNLPPVIMILINLWHLKTHVSVATVSPSQSFVKKRWLKHVFSITPQTKMFSANPVHRMSRFAKDRVATAQKHLSSRR